MVRVKYGTVRPNTVAEINIANNLTRGDVDHDHIATVSTGFSHARVAVDWHIGDMTIGRGRDFVPSGIALGYGRDLPARFGIDNAQTTISLVGDE